jgi:hypothetical protein
MRWTWAVPFLAVVAACDRFSGGGNGNDYSVRDARYDPSQLTSSAGEVSLTDGTGFDYVITSDRFRQWDAARKGFSREVSSRFGALLNPKSPSERSISRAISYLQQQSAARESIERTGMSVRDFVHMTVALEQQMLLASQRRPDDMMADMPYPMDTMPLDTGYLPPAAMAPAPYPYPYPPAAPYPSPYPTPMPLDSARRVDTVYLPSRDTLPVWRDSMRPRVDPRDTLRRDPLRPRVDTARDTIRLPRRDTLRPAPPDTNWRPPPPPPPPPPDSIPTG